MSWSSFKLLSAIEATALVVNLSVTDGSLRRLPPGLGTTWEFQLEGDKEVYNVQLAQTPQELNQG